MKLLNCIQSQQFIYSKADPFQMVRANKGLADLNPLTFNFSVTWRSVFDIKPWHHYQINSSECGPSVSLDVHEKRKYLTLLGFKHQTVQH
jgi:hypothetical protein